MEKCVLFILFFSAICFGSENTQNWYFQKQLYQFHLDNKVLISSNCLYSLPNCLAGKSLKNAKNLDLNGRYVSGGKNPLHMTCLLSNGKTKDLKRNQENQKFCIFKDGSSIRLNDLYQATFDE